MITAWRIVTAAHAEGAFTGNGARTFGGRWHSPGRRVVYTAQSASLAALEILVHLRRQAQLNAFVLFALSFPESLVERIDRSALPRDWRTSPAPPALQELGDAWLIHASSAVLEVPSAVIETESNYLLNPEHPDFARIEVAEAVPFALDLRLLRQ